MDTLVRLLLTLHSVEVMPTGARLTGTAIVPAQKGIQTYVLHGLPAHSPSEYLQAKLKSGKGKIRHTQVNRTILNPLEEPPILQKLRRKIDSLEKKLWEKEGSLHMHKKKLELLEKGTEIPSGDSPTPTTEMLRLSQIYQTHIPTLYYQVQVLQQETQILRDTLLWWKREYQNQKSYYQKPTYELRLTYETPSSEIVTWEIEFFSTAASWHVDYVLRIEATRATIERYANIQNATGLNWKNVQLSLSTQDPQSYVSLPPLDRWEVDAYRPEVRPMAFIQGAQIKALQEPKAAPGEIDRAEESPPPPPLPIIRENPLFRRYEMQTHTIETGKPYRLLIAQDTFPVLAKYRAHPERAPQVYAQAGILGANNVFWENGSIQIIWENQVLRTQSWGSPVEDTTWIDLGIVPQIAVLYQPLKVERKQTLSSQTHTRPYSLRLTNGTPQTVEVEVRLRYPLSRLPDKIKVELENLQDAQKDEEKGQLVWRITLPPQGKWEKRYAFTLRYPKGMILTGF
ncbi:MAG: mucoidy inhibitor MuiA family protein [Bacteroidia bacterium]